MWITQTSRALDGDDTSLDGDLDTLRDIKGFLRVNVLHFGGGGGRIMASQERVNVRCGVPSTILMGGAKFFRPEGTVEIRRIEIR